MARIENLRQYQRIVCRPERLTCCQLPLSSRVTLLNRLGIRAAERRSAIYSTMLAMPNKKYRKGDSDSSNTLRFNLRVLSTARWYPYSVAFS